MHRGHSNGDPGGPHVLLEFNVLIGGDKRLEAAFTRNSHHQNAVSTFSKTETASSKAG